MNAHSQEAQHHGEGHETQASHATFKGYATGFVLSVILTVIPFWIVMDKVFDKPNVTTLVILAIGAVQIFVHMVYFLHMNTRSEGGWSLLALVFTLMLVVITLSGSVWVLYHLNHNMMPMSVQDMKNMP